MGRPSSVSCTPHPGFHAEGGTVWWLKVGTLEAGRCLALHPSWLSLELGDLGQVAGTFQPQVPYLLNGDHNGSCSRRLLGRLNK